MSKFKTIFFIFTYLVLFRGVFEIYRLIIFIKLSKNHQNTEKFDSKELNGYFYLNLIN